MTSSKMFTWWHQQSLRKSADSCARTWLNCPFKGVRGCQSDKKTQIGGGGNTISSFNGNDRWTECETNNRWTVWLSSRCQDQMAIKECSRNAWGEIKWQVMGRRQMSDSQKAIKGGSYKMRLNDRRFILSWWLVQEILLSHRYTRSQELHRIKK